MKDLFNRQFEMLVRVSTFGQNHADLFPSTSLAGQAFAVIASTLAELSRCAGSQAAGFALSREGSTSKAEARAELLNCLDTITLAARAMGREEPEIRAKFQLPRSGKDRALVTVARGFLENAAPMKDRFIAYEVDPTFIEDLEAAIRDFEAAIHTHADTRRSQVAATASLEDVMLKAMDATYRLDGIVPNKLKKSVPLLKEWESVRRVHSGRVPAKAPAEPDTLTPTSAAPAKA